MTEIESISPSTIEPAPPSISNKPNKLLAAKLSRVLSSSASDDARVKSALTALSDIPGLDETELKRNLRGAIERREIVKNKRFLEAFGKVVEQLETLEMEMDNMQATCKAMKESLDKTNAETTHMIEEARNLQEQSLSSKTRLVIVDKFLEKFTLSEQEIRILCSSSVPIDDAFFDALTHLQQIHKDCKVLLVTKNQQAGLQIMESMATHQEAAYEKLYRWTRHESRSSFGGDSIDVSTMMSKSLNALRYRPVLFQTILDELAAARREAVGRAFLNALTRGGPGGTPRPIELQAHDSLRYIGDMLAWVHQACASEKELLESLFQTPSQRNREKSTPSLDSKKSEFDLEDDPDFSEQRANIQASDAIADLLDCAMEGTCRPLKSRMEQVLVLQPGAITSYRVANLIQFYAATIGKLLRKTAALTKTLFDITDMAHRYFFKTLNAQAERLLQSAEPPTKELTISPIVRDMTLQLKEIVSSYDSSFLVAAGAAEGFPEFNFGETLDAIVDPLLRMCELSTEKFTKVDKDIYLVNCMQHIEAALAPFSFTEKKRVGITARMNALLDELATEQYHNLLNQSGLAKIDMAIENNESKQPLSTLPNMDAASIAKTMLHFDSFLIMVSADVSPQLQRLIVSEHCQQVQDGAIRLLLDAYRRIYKAVEDPSNGYTNPETILPRTVEEMEAIFSFAL